MRKMRSWTGALAATGLVLSGAIAGALAPGTVLAGPGTTAVAGNVACAPVAISVRKGRLEGAAGSRFQTVRVTNTSGQACAVPGWTRYRFANAGGPLGFRSKRNPGYDPNAEPVVIEAGDTARSVLSWASPGVVPRNECHPRRATRVRVSIEDLPGHYVLPMDVRVCTTRSFRPRGTRISN